MGTGHRWVSIPPLYPRSSHMHLPLPKTRAGRSLSLKLIQQLREQGSKLASGQAPGDGGGLAGAVRTFREVTLNEPIR